MKISDLKNAVIEKLTIIKASRQELYNRWTTSEGLKTFFGADNQIELKVFGKFEIYFLMEVPKGTRGSEGCQVLSFVPNEVFSFTWNAPPHLEARYSGIYTYVVVSFEEIDKENTKVRLRHLGWPEDKRFLEVYTYFENAWGLVIRNLENCYS